MEEIISQLPPLSQNNSRSIIRAKLEKFQEYPSEARAIEIEEYTGLVPDYDVETLGNAPQGR